MLWQGDVWERDVKRGEGRRRETLSMGDDDTKGQGSDCVQTQSVDRPTTRNRVNRPRCSKRTNYSKRALSHGSSRMYGGKAVCRGRPSIMSRQSTRSDAAALSGPAALGRARALALCACEKETCHVKGETGPHIIKGESLNAQRPRISMHLLIRRCDGCYRLIRREMREGGPEHGTGALARANLRQVMIVRRKIWML